MSYDKRYSETKNVFGADAEKTLEEYEPRLERGDRVLDVGAGQGRNTLYLARRGVRVEAIDPSRVAIDTIRAAADAEGLPVRAFVADFDTFTPDVEIYTGLLLFGLIPILTRESLDSLTKFVDRWLCPGGLLLVSAFTTEDDAFPRHARNWQTVGRNSFADERGDVRTYLEPGELPTLFTHTELCHHWEGLGPWHDHGDGVSERHAWAQAVMVR